MEDFPWLYVAMIFIAFASWIFNRIQEAAAARRQAREPEEEEWEGLDEYRPPERARGSAGAGTAPAPEAPPEPPQSLRDVFREIERQMAEAKRQKEEQSSPPPPPARAPDPPAAPPPLPSVARTPATASRAGASRRPSHASSAAQRTADAERSAGIIPQSARTARLVESQRQAYAHKRNSRKTSDALTGMLRDRSSLRVALLLKEILDEPLSMRQNPRDAAVD